MRYRDDAVDALKGQVNLLDLSGINDILNAGPIEAGTYDRLKLVLNTSTQPDSMNLVTADGTVVAPENITVVDPSGLAIVGADVTARTLTSSSRPIRTTSSPSTSTWPTPCRSSTWTARSSST